MNIAIEELTEWQHAFAANVRDFLEGVYDDFSVLFATPGDSPEESLSDKDMRDILKEALTTLPNAALVIQLFYVEELNVYEIAEILEVSSGAYHR